MKKIFRLSSIKEVLTIVVNKLKKNKKKVVIGLSVFLVVFISVFSFINLRYPTKINAYIAHVINKGEPANSYFDDEVFSQTPWYFVTNISSFGKLLAA